MKKIWLIIVFIITGFTFTTEASAMPRSGDFNYFYVSLSPYGSWLELDYGVYAWRPAVNRRGWAPYSVGRWVWTSYGWYWDSYEPFGYITFHYGRWYFDDYYGWIWIPDYEWGPAWVEWRYDDYYLGWAPLSPYATFSINFGIRFSLSYTTPYSHWHFVKYRHFYDPYVYNYFAAPNVKYRIYSHTKYRSNYDYIDGRIINRGVDVEVIRKRTGQTIREREVVKLSSDQTLRNRIGKRSDRVEAYIPSREEIRNTELRNFEPRRVERKASLELLKIELGDRRENSRDAETRMREENRRDDNQLRKSIEDRNRDNTDRNIEQNTRKDIPFENRNEESNKKREADETKKVGVNTRIRIENRSQENSQKENVQKYKSESNKEKRNERNESSPKNETREKVKSSDERQQNDSHSNNRERIERIERKRIN